MVVWLEGTRGTESHGCPKPTIVPNPIPSPKGPSRFMVYTSNPKKIHIVTLWVKYILYSYMDPLGSLPANHPYLVPTSTKKEMIVCDCVLGAFNSCQRTP